MKKDGWIFFCENLFWSTYSIIRCVSPSVTLYIWKIIMVKYDFYSSNVWFKLWKYLFRIFMTDEYKRISTFKNGSLNFSWFIKKNCHSCFYFNLYLSLSYYEKKDAYYFVTLSHKSNVEHKRRKSKDLRWKKILQPWAVHNFISLFVCYCFLTD